MKPDLEVVCVSADASFTAWSHGYPYRTVRWHFHPEYEIQLITDTSGKYFVGDYIGDFEPGNLVMSGPNLPHNWVSELPDGQPAQQRCLILQFTAEFMAKAIAAFPELQQVAPLLAESRSGLLFTPETGAAALPLMQALLEARGCRRVMLFLSLLELLLKDNKRRKLSSPSYLPDPHSYMASKINLALAYIGKNLSTDLCAGSHQGDAQARFQAHRHGRDVRRKCSSLAPTRPMAAYSSITAMPVPHCGP